MLFACVHWSGWTTSVVVEGCENTNKRKRSIEDDEAPHKRMWGDTGGEVNNELKEQIRNTGDEPDELLQLGMNPTQDGEYDGERNEGENVWCMWRE